jgi:hypothetical protein
MHARRDESKEGGIEKRGQRGDRQASRQVYEERGKLGGRPREERRA